MVLFSFEDELLLFDGDDELSPFLPPPPRVVLFSFEDELLLFDGDDELAPPLPCSFPPVVRLLLSLLLLLVFSLAVR